MRKITWKDKINPIWWMGNLDDPHPPADYKPDQQEWWRYLNWYFRNPLHNFTFYVIGFADRTHLRHPNSVMNPSGRGWNLILPFIAYESKRIKAYIGWRGDRMNFGAKFNIKRG